jgi:outer membrane protein OmpA-like peptidoglycan-associated protein
VSLHIGVSTMRFTSIACACLLAAMPLLLSDAAAQQAAPPSPPAARKPPVFLGPPPASIEGSLRSMEEVRKGRTRSEEGGRLLIREPDRLIVREGDRLTIRHADTFRTRAGARETKVDQEGEEIVTTVTRPDGTRVISAVDKDERLLRRSRIDRHGKEVVIIDDRRAPAAGKREPQPARGDVEPVIVEADEADPAAIEQVLAAAPLATIERPHALDEIRTSVTLRERMPCLDLETMAFDADSWEVKSDQARKLQGIGEAMIKAIRGNPAEFFLIEAHTDVEGSDVDNLSLSDRRAEAVAMMFTRAFGIPPENLAAQGYGEQFPKVESDEPANENRRISIRRITPLLAGTAQAGR